MELWFLLTFFPGSSSENAPRGRSYGSPQHVLPRCSFNCNLVCLVSELPNHGRQRGRRGGDPADLWTALKFLQSFSHAAGLWECRGWPGIPEGTGRGHGPLSAPTPSVGLDSGAPWVSTGQRPEWVSIPGPFLSLCTLTATTGRLVPSAGKAARFPLYVEPLTSTAVTAVTEVMIHVRTVGLRGGFCSRPQSFKGFTTTIHGNLFLFALLGLLFMQLI